MTRKNTADLSMITHVPLQPHWLLHLPAFQSNDARLVRACINMLMAAFHGQPAGTLPNTVEALATVTHLSTEEVQEHLPLLLTGWKKTKDAIVFEPMAQMAMRLSSEYGDAIRRLQDGVAVAIAAPDLFNTELLPDQGMALEAKVSGKTLARAQDLLEQTKVKRLLPQGAQPTPKIRDLLVGRGFTLDSHDEIWQMFVDFHQSRGVRSANWTAEFRNWLGHKTFYGRLDPKSAAPASEPAKSAVRHSFSFGSGRNVNTATARGEASRQQAAENLQKAREAAAAIRARSNPVQGGV